MDGFRGKKKKDEPEKRGREEEQNHWRGFKEPKRLRALPPPEEISAVVASDAFMEVFIDPAEIR